MKITTVSVECHEKRAHPSEMGHYDSRVSLTAEVDEGEVAEIIIADLQYKARQQVGVECDRWIVAIQVREAQEGARLDLQWIVDRLENRLPTDTDTEQFEKKLCILPGAEHDEWREKLTTAQTGYLSGIKNSLTVLIEKARRRQLSPREVSDYDDLRARLPEEERAGYHDRMIDAILAREAENEPKSDGPSEEELAYLEKAGRGDSESMPF